ncbi:MAG: lysophospholipid acyltransferase family protein [Verrucomicrobiia bacterium]
MVGGVSAGIKAIRGSNHWGAREAANAMIKVAKEGGDLGITPDGPRGPIYEFKPGGLIVARRAKIPIILIGFEFSRVKQLRSWDRFIIPLPFSSVTLNARQVLPEDLPKDRTTALAELSTIMAELNGDRH